MAWDSSVTAGMTSQYQGMYAQQMGFSQQLSGFGQYSPYGMNTGMQANSLMMGAARGAGHMANAGMAVGGIAAGLGATAAFGTLAGTGVGVPLAAAGMVAGHVGTQMYGGMEQQHGLNMALRGSYGFRNAQGGTGFNTSQMGQIGGQLREMSHSFGPGGEITSFNELSGLAAKMGQMNMAQGVRDVQTFTKKFKEMTDSLKTMAKDLGTTMEGAMEFANSAKQSGIFGMKGAANFTSMARATAVSGGLAMSEVTAAANIGSQISRSIGGLGRSGAIGGMKTIGQIGTAQQMGILSEEDIYNQTGLTGAEGRQAMSTASMGRTANFLKSGRGRRMLASMAGKDGTLDANAVEQFMSGGMGVPETMAESQKHLGQVGRANFIRNEGRLRGEALSKIGGFGDAMQMVQWAKSKGVDINDMDDRSMLFAQRQLGMGRDEADQAIKMARSMPGILAQQNTDASTDRITQKIAQNRKTQGIEGMKNRFDQAKETINGKLEKMGQDIFNEGSNQIESFLNKLAGVYVQTATSDLNKLEQDIRRGGPGATAARRRALGEGGHISMGGGSALSMGGGTSAIGAFNRGSDGDYAKSWALGQGGQFLMQGQSDRSRMKGLGYDVSGIKDDASLRSFLDRADATKAAAMDPGNKYAGLGAGNDWVDQAYAKDQVSGKNDKRIDSFGALVATKGSDELKKKWAAATSPAEKARIMATIERERGVGGDQSIGANVGGSSDIMMKGNLGGLGAHTQDERNKILGQALGTVKGPSAGQRALSGALQSMIPGGYFFRDKITNMASGDSLAKQKAQGAVIDSNEYKDFLADVYSGDAATRAEGRTRLTDKLKSMKAGEEKDAFKDLAGLAEYGDWAAKNPTASAEERERQARALTGKSAAEAGGRINGGLQTLDERTKKNLEESKTRNKEVHGDIVKRLTSRGLVGSDGQLRSLSASEAKGLGAAGSEYLKQLVESEGKMAKTGEYASQKSIDGMHALMGNMSASELQKFGSMAAGTHEGAMAIETSGIRKSLDRGKARGKGAAGMIASTLGAKLSKDDLKDVDFNDEKSVAAFAGKLGLGGNAEAIKALGAVGGQLGKGDHGHAAASLQKVKGIADQEHAKEERAKKEEQERDSPTYRVMEKVEKHLDEMKKDTKNLGTIATNTASKDKVPETGPGT